MSTAYQQSSLHTQSVQPPAFVDTRYPNEPLSFGQAVVAHHHLLLPPSPSKEAATEHAAPSDSQPSLVKHVIQFDLTEQRKLLGQQKKRVTASNKNESQIKELLQWEGQDLGFTQKVKQDQLKQRCSKKFQSEQRDQFRWFVESPTKKEDCLENDQDGRLDDDQHDANDEHNSSQNLN